MKFHWLLTAALWFSISLLASCATDSGKENIPQNNSKISDKMTGDTLQEFMRSADSVVLISHREPTHSPPDPITGKRNPMSKLFTEDNKLNTALVIKSKRISSSDILRLGNLLDEHVIDDVEYSHCFNPRNAILAYHKTSISYIDVCFECRGLDVVGFPLRPEMSNRKYDMLENFFGNQGVQ